MRDLKNLHAIDVKYIPPTNTKDQHVKLYSYRFRSSRAIPFDHDLNDIAEMAANWLTAKGFNILYRAESKEGYLLLTDTFDPIKNIK